MVEKPQLGSIANLHIQSDLVYSIVDSANK